MATSKLVTTTSNWDR